MSDTELQAELASLQMRLAESERQRKAAEQVVEEANRGFQQARENWVQLTKEQRRLHRRQVAWLEKRIHELEAWPEAKGENHRPEAATWEACVDAIGETRDVLLTYAAGHITAEQAAWVLSEYACAFDVRQFKRDCVSRGRALVAAHEAEGG